jgi:hypothetical protein
VNIYADNLVFKEEKDVELRNSWLRWPLLFLFTNMIMIVSALSLCLSPVTGNLSVAYNVSVLEVNMCGIIFTATFVPLTFVSMWLYKVMDTHHVIRIACLITLFGGWIRILCPLYGFWVVLMG